MSATLIFDFDGTLAVGNGPVLAYARQIAPQAGPDFLANVEDTLARFDAGDDQGFRDGYHVVEALADAHGVGAEARSAAYLASRDVLGTDEAPVDAAPGLADLLDRLPGDVRVVLATNAPLNGLDAALTTWGVRDRIDEIVHDTGKPAGLTPVVREALARGPVLSIGDIVENDLAPATALGADTALVGATASSSPAAVTMRATTLDALSDDIVGWARQRSSLPTTD